MEKTEYERERERERFISWHLTSDCPEDCGYGFCQHNIPDLQEREYGHILQQIIDSGIDWVAISGGEPLLNPYCIDIIKALHNAGIKVQLNTAGIPLTREIFEQIKHYVKIIALPFESLDDELNKEIRKSENHRETIINAINMIKGNSDIYVKINTTVHAKNIDHINELGEFLDNSPIDEWQLRQFFPVQANARNNKKEYVISQTEYSKILYRCLMFFPELLSSRTHKDFLDIYLMIEPNGDLIRASDITHGSDEHFENKLLGNLLNDNLNLNAIYDEQEITSRTKGQLISDALRVKSLDPIKEN